MIKYEIIAVIGTITAFAVSFTEMEAPVWLALLVALIAWFALKLAGHFLYLDEMEYKERERERREQYQRMKLRHQQEQEERDFREWSEQHKRLMASVQDKPEPIRKVCGALSKEYYTSTETEKSKVL